MADDQSGVACIINYCVWDCTPLLEKKKVYGVLEFMKQKQKNIRLLIVLAALIVITVVVWMTGGTSNTLDVPVNLFSYPETETIDLAIVGGDTLTYTGTYWQVNGEFKADPQRVQVLFAIASQLQVRRKASKAQIDSLNNILTRQGVKVELYSGDNLMKEYQVWGDARRGMTWVRNEESEIPYLVEIPGYRSYLGGIFELDENSWRYPIIFDINWQNLQGVEVFYPNRQGESFEVNYSEGFYQIPALQETDSTKLTDFLDNLSLLYVNDFLFESEMADYDSLLKNQQAHIVIQDVGKNNYVLDIYEKIPGRDEILIRIDSSDYGLADFQRVKTLLKPRSFFRKQ
jgi:hypothetical protein